MAVFLDFAADLNQESDCLAFGSRLRRFENRLFGEVLGRLRERKTVCILVFKSFVTA